MSQVISEVIGVIEMEIDHDRFQVWIDGDCSSTVSPMIRSRSPVGSSAIIVADMTQLTEDLRQELIRVLFSFD